LDFAEGLGDFEQSLFYHKKYEVERDSFI